MKINVKAISEAIKRNNEEFAVIPNKFEIEDIEYVETVENGYGRDNVRQTINIFMVHVSFKAKKYEHNKAQYKIWYYEKDKEACANFYGTH